MKNFIVRSVIVAAVATSAFGSVALAASDDPSRSDAVYVRAPDHSKVPTGKHYTGDTLEARSVSRSDSVYVRDPDHSKVARGVHFKGEGSAERSSSRSDSVGWH
jgi:hypothetical protein